VFRNLGHRLNSKFGALRVYIFGNDDRYPLQIGLIIEVVAFTLIMIAGAIQVFEWLS
jgi:hypothetical protein